MRNFLRNHATAIHTAYQAVQRTPLLGAATLRALNLHGAWVSSREARRDYGRPAWPLAVNDSAAPVPTLAAPVSQLCTASQFREPLYRHWTREIRSPARFSRKQWEFVYILQALDHHGMLASGRLGIGFGCGREPLAAVMAKHGAELLATDLDLDEARTKGWVDGRQHASELSHLNRHGICPPAQFAARVRYETCDMNAIPERYHGQFDFTWSACALEHLGSLRHGVDFIIASLRCLRPGGVAVHTTEFNLSSNEDTVETPGCSLYRRRDIEALRDELTALGYEIAPLNFNAGNEPVDRYVDVPPFFKSPHLRVELGNYAATSIGLIIRRV